MKNFIMKGDTVSVTAPYTVTSGMLVLVGSIFGVAVNDAANGAPAELTTKGVFDVPKTSALAINAGDLVYLDDVNHVVNKTAAAQKLVGVAMEAAVNPSAIVRVRLNGAFTT
ncbi:MAG: DUF2190 family protein [Bryobacteraceae bacterium]|nr:DUF2190 family protein [Bryobacteraceae bacterium]